MDSFPAYRQHLLPHLKRIAKDEHHLQVKDLQDKRNSHLTYIKYMPIQKYNHDSLIMDHGYKVVKNVFDDTNSLRELANSYDVDTLEFADKDSRFSNIINNDILSNQKFIDLYKSVYGTDFLWQKTTIHRKRSDGGMPIIDVHRSTVEHVDLTETPNSKLTITAYIALTDQNKHNQSRLLVYPGTHKLRLKIPMNNFDYLSNKEINIHVIKDLNYRVAVGLTESWIRDSLYYIICIGNKKFDILKSTLTLLAYNPELLQYKPKIVNLAAGDVLFFTSNLLHCALDHNDYANPRVSLAVRGGQPYHEESHLIDNCVSNDVYEKIGPNVPRNVFLFSGTQSMIEKFETSDIIYNLNVLDHFK